MTQEEGLAGGSVPSLSPLVACAPGGQAGADRVPASATQGLGQSPVRAVPQAVQLPTICAPWALIEGTSDKCGWGLRGGRPWCLKVTAPPPLLSFMTQLWARLVPSGSAASRQSCCPWPGVLLLWSPLQRSRPVGALQGCHQPGYLRACWQVCASLTTPPSSTRTGALGPSQLLPRVPCKE